MRILVLFTVVSLEEGDGFYHAAVPRNALCSPIHRTSCSSVSCPAATDWINSVASTSLAVSSRPFIGRNRSMTASAMRLPTQRRRRSSRPAADLSNPAFLCRGFDRPATRDRAAVDRFLFMRCRLQDYSALRASPLRGRRRKAAGAQLGLRPSCRTRLFYVAGSTDWRLGIGPPSIDFYLCGAGCRIRTRDLRFTKPLHYHCAKPANQLVTSLPFFRVSTCVSTLKSSTVPDRIEGHSSACGAKCYTAAPVDMEWTR
jgi:hypothetical protein